MQALDIIFQNIEETEGLRSLIRQEISKLNKEFKDIIGYHVTVGRPEAHEKSEKGCRVHIEVRVPGGDLVTIRESGRRGDGDLLHQVVRGAFQAARLQLENHLKKQRKKRRKIPETRNIATIAKLFPEDGYGFIKSTEGREIFFNRKSVLYDEFDQLEIGTDVLYAEEQGEKGIQARQIEIVKHMS